MSGIETDSYLTIENTSDGLFKDRGSKFIALAYPVRDEKEIREILLKVKRKYHDARHHCYAWKLGAEKAISRVSDDGEPGNTAGKPIMAQIEAFNLTNVLVVVVRYFGGTLLGVGGLIHAYKTASHEALQNARVVRKHLCDICLLKFAYQEMNEVMRLIKNMDLSYYDQILAQDCELKVKVPRERLEEFKNHLIKNLNIACEFYRKE